MKLHPAYLVLLALVLLAAAAYLEMGYVMLLGFPDNATTEYERAISHAVWLFDRFTVGVSVWLIALAVWARRHDVRRIFFATVAIYALAAAVVVALDHHYEATLPGPKGG